MKVCQFMLMHVNTNNSAELWNLIQNRDSCDDNLPAVDALAGFDDDARAQAKAAKVKVRATAGPSKAKKRKVTSVETVGDDDAVTSKAVRPKKGKAPVGEIVVDDPAAAPSTGPSKGKGKGKASIPIDVSDDSEEEEEDDALPPAKKKKGGKEVALPTAGVGGSKKRKTLAGSNASQPPSPVKPPAKKSKTDIPASPSTAPPSPIHVDAPHEVTGSPTPPSPSPVKPPAKKSETDIPATPSTAPPSSVHVAAPPRLTRSPPPPGRKRAATPPSPSPFSAKSKGKQRATTPPPPSLKRKKQQPPPPPLPPPSPSLPAVDDDDLYTGVFDEFIGDFEEDDRPREEKKSLNVGPTLYKKPLRDGGRWYIADKVAVPDDFPFSGLSVADWNTYYKQPQIFPDSPTHTAVWEQWNNKHYAANVGDWDLDSGLPPPVSPSTSLSALSSLPDHFKSTQPSEDDSSDNEDDSPVHAPKTKPAKVCVAFHNI